MKKSQFLIATLCMSALVLSSCTTTSKSKKKKKSSSSDITSVTGSGDPTSAPTSAPTSGSTAPTPTSGSSTQPGPVKTLVSIAVTTAPTKTVYNDGETFDPTGMVVTATYSDNSTENVTSSCTFSPSPLTQGTTSVTVSYQGKTATQLVTVNAPVPTSWSTEQTALLNQYLRDKGSEVPYVYVPGASLVRDTEYALLYYGGGTDTCTDEFLDAYAALWAEDWNVEKNALYALFGITLYQGSKTFEGGELGSFTLYVSIYADDDDHFELDVSDGSYYSWEEFSGEYQSVLDYVYDEQDEEEMPVEFPDAIPFEGKFDLIETQDYLDDNGYYVVYIENVSEDDWLEWIDAFFESSKWHDYQDTINDCDAFYHESEKVAIGYNYYSSAKIGEVLIHSYTKIYQTWPGEVVSDYVKSVNPDTTVVVPEFDANSYVCEVDEENGYIGVFSFGSDAQPVTQEAIDKYVDDLDPTIWNSEVLVDTDEEEIRNEEGYLIWFNTEAEAEAYIADEGIENAHVEMATDDDGDYYYIVVEVESEFYYVWSLDHSIEMQAAFVESSGYGAIIVMPNAPLASAYPGTAIGDYFTAKEVSVENVSSLSIANPLGGFHVEADEKGVLIKAYDATDEEVEAFISGLTGNGWVLDEESSSDEENFWTYMYGETLARCQVADYREVGGVHAYIISFDVKVVAWSEEQAALFAEHLHTVVPPYFDADISYDEEEDYFYFYVGSSATQELMNAYYAFVGDENWEQDGEYVSFSCPTPDGEGEVLAYWGNSGYFLIYYHALSWTEEEAKAFSDLLHGVVPPYLGDIYTEGTTTTSMEGSSLYEEEELAQFDEVLTADEGWSKVGEGASAYYKKDSTDGEGYAKVEFKYYENGDTKGYYWYVSFVGSSPVPPTPGGDPVTINTTVEAIATANSWVSGTIYSSFKLDENITVTASAGSNNGKYWEASSGKQYRLFESESGTMTISAPEGYVIQSVTLTFNYENTGILMCGETQVSSGTAVEVNAQSVTFTVSQTDSSKHGKIFITNFVVVYAPAAA